MVSCLAASVRVLPRPSMSCTTKYIDVPKQRKYTFLFLSLFLLASVLSSISMGAVEISLSSLVSILNKYSGLSGEIQHSQQQEAVFFTLRLPRALMGLLIGGTLSISGAVIQGMFRNPLAEPGLVGISSGASLFAILMIVLETKLFSAITAYFGYYALAAASFFGAMITTFIVYRFSVRSGKTDVASLLLVGIAINALVGASTGLLTYIATDEQLRSITFWSLGSLGGANWDILAVLFPCCLICVSVLLTLGKPLNAMALGESQATHLGVPAQRLKMIIVGFAAIGVGACVAFSGIIGFISLVIPHILRISVTGDNVFVLPASVLLGGGILVFADLLARTLVAPSELPIGILTAFMGAPVFIYIIVKQQKSRSIL